MKTFIGIVAWIALVSTVVVLSPEKTPVEETPSATPSATPAVEGYLFKGLN